MRPEIAIRTIAVSLVAQLIRQIKNNGNRNAMKLPAKLDDRFASLGLYVCGINHNQFARCQTLRGDEMQNLKGIIRSRLTVLVVGHEATAKIRRKNFRRPKMLASEARLARA